MSDQGSASAEKAKRSVAILQLTGRNEEGRVVGFPVRTVHAVEPVSLAALGTLGALGLAFLAVCAGPPLLGLCCQG